MSLLLLVNPRCVCAAVEAADMSGTAVASCGMATAMSVTGALGPVMAAAMS